MSRTYQKNYPAKKISKRTRQLLDIANSPIMIEDKFVTYQIVPDGDNEPNPKD